MLTTVLYTHLDGYLTPQIFDCYLEYLNTAGQQKILRLRRPQDRQASLLGKMLLLQGLIQFGYNKGTLKSMAYTDYSRPYIDLPLDFSISHSGNIIACALSSKGKVGIDVEEIRPVKIEDFNDIFSPGEYQRLLRADNPFERFFTIWTRKEAVVKANGKGLYIPLKEIDVQNDIIPLHNDTWHLDNILLEKNYSSSIATNYLPEKEPAIAYISKDRFNFS